MFNFLKITLLRIVSRRIAKWSKRPVFKKGKFNERIEDQ